MDQIVIQVTINNVTSLLIINWEYDVVIALFWVHVRASDLSTVPGIMKEQRIVTFGTFNKPVHRIYHVLPCRMLGSIGQIIREYHNVFWSIMVPPYEKVADIMGIINAAM